MATLLLDSSNRLLCVGLAKDNVLVDQIVYEAWQRQSEVMVPEIDNIMKRNNVTRNDIDSIVVGIGPGSYTGIRIALTIAKTIAYVTKAKVYKVSSLSLFKIPHKATICVTNARSNRSYFAVYKDDEVIMEDQILENDEVFKYIKEHPDYVVSGESEHLDIVSEKFDVVKNLLSMKKEENLVDNIFKLNPVYLKDLYKWATS